jgi:hypothetical protein
MDSRALGLSLELCAAGRFKIGSGECMACPHGKFQASAGQTTCSGCIAGQYQDVEGQLACRWCGLGRFTGAADTQACEECPPGKHAPARGAITCPGCQSGRHSDAGGSASCRLCRRGRFSAVGALQCEHCPRSKHGHDKGGCALCESGRFSNTSGLSVCEQCAPNAVTAFDRTRCACGAGFVDFGEAGGGRAVSTPGGLLCQRSCPPGTVLNASAGNCTQCPAGAFSGSVNAAECSLCPACDSGTRQGCGGATAGFCLDCPSGKFLELARAPASVEHRVCTACPVGTFSQSLNLPRCKECPEGKFVASNGSLVCDELPATKFVFTNPVTGERTPGECPTPGLEPEFTCTDGVLTYEPVGFWRDGLVPHAEAPGVYVASLEYVPSQATQFYACPHKEACAVRPADGTVTCMAHSAGLLCALCAEGFTSGGSGGGGGGGGSGCAPCPASILDVLWPALVALALALAAAALWLKRLRPHWPAFKRRVLRGRDVDLVVPFKIALSFFQVVLLQPDVFDVRLPRLYLDFLQRFQWLALELPFRSLECFAQVSYHTKVDSAVGLSAAIMAVLLLGVTRSRSANQRHGRLLGLCIVPSYMLYPSISSVLFQTFMCRSIDSKRFLTKDLSIDCTSAEHRTAESRALVMIALFSFGLPVIYQALLFPHRRQLVTSTQESAARRGETPYRRLIFL